MQLQGSITALATPFTANGTLDFPAWQKLLDLQLQGGTQGVVVAGSTGEAQMLSDEEFIALTTTVVEHINGRIPVLAGAGLSATDKTLRQCKIAANAGADAVLVVTPPYVRPTQEGLRRHFETIAHASPVPVVLYNVPSRSACDMTPETVAALASHENIIGIKETVFQAARIKALVQLRSPGFALAWGDDPTALQVLLDGADAVISVASNAIPAAFRALCDAGLARDEKTGRALDAELSTLWQALSLEPNPVPLKALLAELDICAELLRLPLVPLSSPHRAALVVAANLSKSLEARYRKSA